VTFGRFHENLTCRPTFLGITTSVTNERRTKERTNQPTTSPDQNTSWRR